jgi:hypothetical protein
MILLFDMPVSAGGVGVFAAVAVLLVFGGAAFIAFKLLKRTMKMAFRIAIVGIILAIGLAGSIFFWAVGTSKPTRPARPASSTR